MDTEPMDRSPLELRGLLGEGAAGSVHRAVDRVTGMTYALKLLHRTTPAGLERFRREGEITAGLVHPNIVRLHSTGVREGRPYLAYELIEGARALDEVLGEAPLRRRIEMLRDVARALGHAHRRGVVHRDVKPANVLVGADGRVRLTDFGVALSDEHERLTRTGGQVGTPRFMAPEQITGERAQLGPATDVWALGVLLYLALTGGLPFEADSLGELASRICAGVTEPPGARAEGVPAALQALCLSALEVDQARRPRDGDAVADALDAWLRDGGAGSPAPRRAGGALIAAGLLGAVGASLGVAALAPVAPPPVEAPKAEVSRSGSPSRAPSWEATFAQGVTYEVSNVSGVSSESASSGRLAVTLTQARPSLVAEAAPLAAVIDRLSFQASIASTLIVFDSSDRASLPGFPEFRAFLFGMIGTTTRLSIDARSGRCSSVRGVPRFRRGSQDELLPELLGEFARAFSDETLEGMLQDSMCVFPTDGARAADGGWRSQARLWVSPTFGVDLERRFEWRDADTAVASVRLVDAPAIPTSGVVLPFTTVDEARVSTRIEFDGPRVVLSETTIDHRDPLASGVWRRGTITWRAVSAKAKTPESRGR